MPFQVPEDLDHEHDIRKLVERMFELGQQMSSCAVAFECWLDAHQAALHGSEADGSGTPA